jgi:hypothetical protein
MYGIEGELKCMIEEQFGGMWSDYELVMRVLVLLMVKTNMNRVLCE